VIDLDPTDRRLLSALQKKGRLSNAELSEQVNLSPSACHRRVQRLEKDGYIDGYVALVNPRKVQRKTTVFVEITLRAQADDVLAAFEASVAKVPDVLECHLIFQVYRVCSRHSHCAQCAKRLRFRFKTVKQPMPRARQGWPARKGFRPCISRFQRHVG